MNGEVLIVDDTPANIRLLEAILTTHGHQVRSAGSGEAALALIASENPPDLVLLDVQMPGLDGYEVCRRIRADPATAQIPVVMITASGSEDKATALECGADDFIPRPFDQAELLARVRSSLRVKQYQDTVVAQAAELGAWNRVLEEQVNEQVEELHRLQRLRRFLSDHVADAVLSSGNEALLQPHRREISLMFCDLRGFTHFAAASEPEEVLTALQEFHALVGATVARHAATVGYFAGDGVMMFFNDPIACDNPALRAISAAIELRDAMAPLAERWHERGHALSIGIGVAYGFATIGLIGFEGRYEYTAIGSVANIASRLCDCAGPGEILITQRAHLAAGDRVVASSRGELTLSGVDAPVGVWEVSSATELLQPLRERAPARVENAVVMPAPGPNHAAGASGVEIRVLGPTELLVDGADVPLRSFKVRQLLCLLAAQRDQVLSVDRLTDQLWDGEPPDSATPTLRVYISRLRKLLSGVGRQSVLVTRPTGYQLAVGDGELDSVRFDQLVARGRAALQQGDPETAAALLRESLDLWRGTPYSDITNSPAVVTECARLGQERLSVQEDFLDAELACGRHRMAIGLLEALVAENPLRERLWAQRMIALYRSGRQPEALASFQDLRRHLSDELGLDPSPELADLHGAILNRSSSLDL